MPWLRRFAMALIVLFPVIPVSAQDLPQALLQAGDAYWQVLEARDTPALDATASLQLAETASIVSGLGECRQALTLRRLVLGPDSGFADWSAQARDAHCARDWRESVGAAYRAYTAARSDLERFRALRLLGSAVVQDWRFDNAAALAVYRAASRYGSDRHLRTEIARLTEDQRQARALRLEAIEVRDAGEEPSLCLRFNHSMPTPGERAYQDFFRTEPRIPARFRQGDTNEICIDGGEFDRHYQVTVLEGLTDTEGRSLHATRQERVHVGPRSASLRFQSHLYVLPRGSTGVPLHAVNVDAVELALYRIDERNLLAPEVRELFGTDLSSWSESRIADELGARVWSGQGEWTVEPNREQRVLLPLVDDLQAHTGIYVVTARVQSDAADEYPGPPRASQWLVVSDLGITTYQGRDGLTVGVRGLGDARPRSGVRLQLLARNNTRLAETRTDRRGFAQFSGDVLRGQGGLEPVLLFALNDDGDFNFLDVSRSPFDLSDRGVSGRAHPGPLDAYLHTERGVYRPGESVHLGLLLRDDSGRAAPPVPLTLRLLRPDDTLAWEELVHPEAAGGLSSTLRLPAGARTGRWTLLAHVDPDAAPVGQTSFQVQAILPPRLEARFDALPDAPLPVERPVELELQADYLFGAPAADLEVRSELRIAVDPNPFDAFPGFRFGPLGGEGAGVVLPLDDARTDATGRARLALSIDRLPDPRAPLRAELRSEVVDVDGRVVTATASRLVDTGERLLGVRVPGDPGPEGHVLLNEGAQARFEIVAVNARGELLDAAGLEYRLVEERIHYQWYQESGRWQYRREIRERDRGQGRLDVTGREPAALAFALDWGRYRLDLQDPDTGARASARVQLGWGGAPGPDDPPDRLQVQHDRPAYRPGTEAVLSIEGNFDGPGQVVIAGDRVLEILPFWLEEGQGHVEIPVDADWGAGAYALVTVFRPEDARAGLGPRRAIGVAWLGLDPDPATLAVNLNAPERLRPLQTLEVGVEIPDHRAGEPVFLTVSAVDDGLLQLTGHPPPRPIDHFFGQRRLGLDIRDLYGRLLDGRTGQPGRIGTGAGVFEPDASLEPPVTMLSLFSGVVALDAEGRGVVRFDLPEFEGRVRLNAVAWSSRRMGHASRPVTVRDPVVLQTAMPRFLAEGDRGTATVTLFNAEGPDGGYRLRWHQRKALAGLDGSRTLTLDRGRRQVVTLPLQGERQGHGELLLELEGPEGLSVERRLELAVRPAFARRDIREAGRLEPDGTRLLGGAAVAGLIPETLSSQITLDSRPQWDVAGLVRQLDLYPYGCLEQVASAAFPLLDLPGLLDDPGAQAPDPQRVPDAVTRILEMQLDNGGFTLWGGSGEPDVWVSVYAIDFLGEARRQGVEVPDFAWERGLHWLRALVELPETRDARRIVAQSYGLYVLARNGAARSETARYLLDVVGERLPSGLAAGHLGAALALDGDEARAQKAFGLTERLRRAPDLADYGSALRDRAEVLRLAAAHAPEALDLGTHAEALATAFTEERWLSTQEQAALVRAAAVVSADGRELNLTFDQRRHQAIEGPLLLQPDSGALREGVTLHNLSGDPLWYALLASGHPRQPPPVEVRGLRIERQIFTLDGETLGRDAVEQGTVLVVVLEGEAVGHAVDEYRRLQLLVADPIPAGLEADSPGLEGSRTLDGLDWLGEVSPTLYNDALDDRFVAALDLELGTAHRFRVAYIARAVTPGAYRMGPSFVEDMYKPYLQGRGASGWLHVRARP
ncbi:Alpha-2-macroglobulin [Thioalkalivibrio nitratireducens DSM 14787]|uniref:Alpha-2-macroglobulin n=1 Tax=Thioalkalivibrio nitratireducens (strain DSM 14787 / UNIQEM 213 / ALEN2) TaxID=1255043 RepID=L0DWA2_THIND|nr:alpha-2-macroglobulin [Thioalkalivibrio nitratireducens]AGA33297.1 Alpha-2-macroglobulin [Thioalkalivibrio nitratireducens DSM 14787]